MAKHDRIYAGPDGWSKWVVPVMDGYKLTCCDCGLVHDMQFSVLRTMHDHEDGPWAGIVIQSKKYRVRMRARRNNRSTAAVRRHMLKEK